MSPGAAYPTPEQVEAASKEQLGRWSRFLPSPGAGAIGEPKFQEVLTREVAILDRILERFRGLGGWTPDLSKAVGWER